MLASMNEACIADNRRIDFWIRILYEMDGSA